MREREEEEEEGGREGDVDTRTDRLTKRERW